MISGKRCSTPCPHRAAESNRYACQGPQPTMTTWRTDRHAGQCRGRNTPPSIRACAITRPTYAPWKFPVPRPCEQRHFAISNGARPLPAMAMLTSSGGKRAAACATGCGREPSAICCRPMPPAAAYGRAVQFCGADGGDHGAAYLRGRKAPASRVGAAPTLRRASTAGRRFRKFDSGTEWGRRFTIPATTPDAGSIFAPQFGADTQGAAQEALGHASRILALLSPARICPRPPMRRPVATRCTGTSPGGRSRRHSL